MSSDFDRQESDLNRVIEESLVEGKHFNVHKEDEDLYQWTGKLSNGSYVGEEYSFYETPKAARSAAISSLTETYKELACAPVGLPVEDRDFTIYQDEPHYASWESCGETFGTGHKAYDLYVIDIDVREHAITSLRREYINLGSPVDLKDPFSEDEIVSIVRDHSTELFRRAWVEKNVMPRLR